MTETSATRTRVRKAKLSEVFPPVATLASNHEVEATEFAVLRVAQVEQQRRRIKAVAVVLGLVGKEELRRQDGGAGTAHAEVIMAGSSG